MKGLLKKDLCMLWNYCRSMILILAAFTLVGAFMEDSFFYSFYPVLIVSMLPVTLISYDERFKWDIYCQSLPISRRVQVTEKYLLSLLSVLVVILCCIAAQIYRMLDMAGFNASVIHWGSLPQFVAMLVGLGLISPSLMIPLIYKFGAEKGRMVFFVVVGFFCALGAMVSVKGSMMQVPSFPEFAVILVCLVLFGISWLISVTIYEKKQF
ncbi:MAG: ABC-2 transporter permease [Lachnospiraceae bacterium]|nr:ABC-2 transporter permease [Lachnospiraceae bacterium]